MNIENDPTVTVIKSSGKRVEKKAPKASKTTSTDKVVQEANAALAAVDAKQRVADRIASMSEPSVRQNTPDDFIGPPKPANLPSVSAVQVAIDGARKLHRQMKVDFIDSIASIAQQVMAAKAAAKKENVVFESLFGDIEDPSKFPFSQNWANTVVRVYESKVLNTSDIARLPADITTLATYASIKPEKREAALVEYEEGRTGDYTIIEGEVFIGKLTTQKAMKRAKAKVEAEDAEEVPAKVKKPKDFNATRMAKVLLRELGTDGLSELADAIELILAEEGVR